jgi:methanogenic corrinoid protein MtbC1
MDIHEALREKIEIADRVAAYDLLEQWAGEYGYERLIAEVIEPVFKEIGEAWDKEGFSLAQAYIAAKIGEDFLTKYAASQAVTLPERTLKGPVVLGNIEDDSHALGRKMVVTFLKANGWEIYDLGNDVLASEFVEKALKVGAKVIGVSAMMYTTALNIKSLRAEIDRRGLTGKIQLAVGGAVFVLRPDLVDEIGGDGTARNAMAAPALFDDLWEKACLKENDQ